MNSEKEQMSTRTRMGIILATLAILTVSIVPANAATIRFVPHSISATYEVYDTNAPAGVPEFISFITREWLLDCGKGGLHVECVINPPPISFFEEMKTSCHLYGSNP